MSIGFACVLFAVLALIELAGAVSQPDRAQISYFLAQRSPASTGLDASFGGQATVRDIFMGEEIVRTVSPVVSVPASSVREAKAFDIAHKLDSEKYETIVRLTFSSERQEGLDTLRRVYPDYWLLVVVAGTPADIVPLAGYPTAGFSGGVFETFDAAVELYRAMGIELTRVEASNAAVEDWKRFNQVYEEALQWYAQCEPTMLEELGGERSLEGTQDSVSTKIDCSARPPFPPAPPSRPAVCTVSTEEGELKEGKRVGVWSVFNPYGRRIRLDHYQEGELSRSVWLRSCGD